MRTLLNPFYKGRYQGFPGLVSAQGSRPLYWQRHLCVNSKLLGEKGGKARETLWGLQTMQGMIPTEAQGGLAPREVAGRHYTYQG